MKAFSVGLGPSTYRALLTDYVSELLASRGGSYDTHELVGRLLHKWGFSGFFDDADKLRQDDVKAALAELLPPAPVDAKQAQRAAFAAAEANHFGCASRAEFDALSAEKRLALLEQAKAAPAKPAPSAANHYGMGSQDAFNALSPENRLARIHEADAAAAKPAHKPLGVQLPTDSTSWAATDKLAYVNCKTDVERDAAAEVARANVKADAVRREETDRQIKALSARTRNA